LTRRATRLGGHLTAIESVFVTMDNSPQAGIIAPGGLSGADLFDTPGVVAVEYNGSLHDLFLPVPEGVEVKPVMITSDEGLEILRHSAAHVAAQAVQAINPEAKLGIGPPVTDGFYYDFDVAEPFSPEDLSTIEKEMQRIVKAGQRFQRRVVTAEEARAELANEPYKLELVGLKDVAGSQTPAKASRSALAN